jgi:hypothetical protein
VEISTFPGEAAVMVSPERVSVLDASNLRVERYGLPMHMAALVILDAGPLLDVSGELRLAAVQAHIDGRTRSARRLRQVLTFPRRGRPVWAGVQDFDITHHVGTRVLPRLGMKPPCSPHVPNSTRCHWTGPDRSGRSGS